MAVLQLLPASGPIVTSQALKSVASDGHRPTMIPSGYGSSSDSEARHLDTPGAGGEQQARGAAVTVLRSIRFPLMPPEYLASGRVQAALPPALAELAAGMVREALAVQMMAQAQEPIPGPAGAFQDCPTELWETAGLPRTAAEPALLGLNSTMAREGRPVQWGRYAEAAVTDSQAGAAGREEQGPRTGAGRCEFSAATADEAMAVAVSGGMVCCGLANGSIQVFCSLICRYAYVCIIKC
jgi:hypothetical protein